MNSGRLIRADEDFVRLLHKTKAHIEMERGIRLSDKNITRLMSQQLTPKDILSGIGNTKFEWKLKWK